MNNSEIRIGNIVTTSSQYAKIQIPSMLPFIVFGIGFSKCELLNDLSLPWACQEYIEIENRFIHPIPITPEWLERLGFEREEQKISNCDVYKKGFYKIHVNPFGTIYFSHYTMGGFYLSELKSIHQLQNLYHALTGQELTVKELTPSIS